MTDDPVPALIAQAKREQWTELDLSGRYLEDLPPELGALDQLRVLKLGWNEETRRFNYLRELPDWMVDLVTRHLCRSAGCWPSAYDTT